MRPGTKLLTANIWLRSSWTKTPREMSEDMKVKCNLLLPLSHKAEILILDEPASGLDPFSRDELLEIFLTLKKEGVAIFFSTHIISDIEKCADDIVYISGGRIVADDDALLLMCFSVLMYLCSRDFAVADMHKIMLEI